MKSLKDTEKLARRLTKKVLQKGGPFVIALYGDLGAGKTTFARFLAKALGIKEKILSPTFVIIKTFSLPRGQRMVGDFSVLVHIDAYRLKSAKDLTALGLKDILKDKENILVIEWPEKIEKYLPSNTTRLYFEVVGEKKRKVVIENPR